MSGWTPGPARAVAADRPGCRARRRRRELAQFAAFVPSPRVTLKTPMSPEVSAGIVCLEVDGQRPPEVVARLRDAGVVASSTPYRTSYVRLGPSIATSPDQVDRAVDAIGGLA